MTMDTLVALVGVTGALFLAVRGLQSRGISFENKAAMAVAWVVIIVLLAFVLQRFAA
ncbi:hypothetical protein [Novosphingobium sp. JCM 18896]|uniref:hypothetical protein n=1 Tax=Novosphingobium sp. JCM 18896 TaxID=2989731 RepID=UPI002223A671|nr:hypothetical protein [Novosphingobium sp. JCM 18896]MCW1428472.1 hypothetical protein [Novosphingobium sp. JCM 18896]